MTHEVNSPAVAVQLLEKRGDSIRADRAGAVPHGVVRGEIEEVACGPCEAAQGESGGTPPPALPDPARPPARPARSKAVSASPSRNEGGGASSPPSISLGS